MIEMIVGGLGFDPRNLSPLVLLRDHEEMNFLPIWIGVFEAASIAMELQGVKPPRPMTHDLLISAIELFGGKIRRIVINDVKEGTFYSIIELENKEGKTLELDARPSDAIALAVRSHSQIFVSEVVMMQAKLVNSEKDAEETKKFKEFIENMRPEDFTKFYKQD
ncbi:MAG: bifunctional nuclease family protein [Candidatus Margulisbacteria bacterium]|nr:bifunctional nuclease family protein [Candidatus Margulisiibacteriota bacterium]